MATIEQQRNLLDNHADTQTDPAEPKPVMVLTLQFRWHRWSAAGGWDNCRPCAVAQSVDG
jgi:hypothetical protein